MRCQLLIRGVSESGCKAQAVDHSGARLQSLRVSSPGEVASLDLGGFLSVNESEKNNTRVMLLGGLNEMMYMNLAEFLGPS